MRSGDNKVIDFNEAAQISRFADLVSEVEELSFSENPTRIEILSYKNKYEIDFYIPAEDYESLHVGLDGDILIIEGTNVCANSAHSQGFYKRFNLPHDVSKDKIVAKYRNDVLQIIMPKLQRH